MAYSPLIVGTPVDWGYRETHGYGYVAKVLIKGVDAAHTKYRMLQVDDHVSASGSREPKYVIHWGSDVHEVSRATVTAAKKRAEAR